MEDVHVSISTVSGHELVSESFDSTTPVLRLQAKAAKEMNVHTDWTYLLLGSTILDPSYDLADSLVPNGCHLSLVIATRPQWSLPEQALLRVTNAGSGLANGLYYPVGSFPNGVGPSMGPRKWRHKETNWLYIFHQEMCWWIGHYADNTHDLYCTAKGDKQRVPCGWPDQGWTVLDNCIACPCQRGVAPPPTLEWSFDEDLAPSFASCDHDEAGLADALLGPLRERVLNAVQDSLLGVCTDMHIPREKRQRSQAIQTQIVLLFRSWNTSRSQSLTLGEFTRGLAFLGIPGTIAMEAFLIADANADRRVDEAEFMDWLFMREEILDCEEDNTD